MIVSYSSNTVELREMRTRDLLESVCNKIFIDFDGLILTDIDSKVENVQISFDCPIVRIRSDVGFQLS